MLKIRYNIETLQLSGWTDNEAEFDLLEDSKDEATKVLDINKPDANDYEYYAYNGTELVSSGKQPPIPRRNLFNEIDELKVRVKKLEK